MGGKRFLERVCGQLYSELSFTWDEIDKQLSFELICCLFLWISPLNLAFVSQIFRWIQKPFEQQLNPQKQASIVPLCAAGKSFVALQTISMLKQGCPRGSLHRITAVCLNWCWSTQTQYTCIRVHHLRAQIQQVDR